jgi:hypothetical protein
MIPGWAITSSWSGSPPNRHRFSPSREHPVPARGAALFLTPFPRRPRSGGAVTRLQSVSGTTPRGTRQSAASTAAGTRGARAATSPALRSSRPHRVPFVLEPSTPTPTAPRPIAALPPTASVATPRCTPTTIPYLSNAASPSLYPLRRQRHRDTVTPRNASHCEGAGGAASRPAAGERMLDAAHICRAPTAPRPTGIAAANGQEDRRQEGFSPRPGATPSHRHYVGRKPSAGKCTC